MTESWSRRDDESSRAYFCFLQYLNAGAERSVRATFRQVSGKPGATQAPGSWNTWVERYEWLDRAAAYDSHQQQLADDDRRKLARADEKKWQERRRALREEEFEVSRELVAKGRQILLLPILEQRIEKSAVVGKETIATLTIVQPVKGAMQAATKMIAHGSLLLRRSTQMEKHEDEDSQTEGTGAKVIRFPVAVPDKDEWSAQYRKA